MKLVAFEPKEKEEEEAFFRVIETSKGPTLAQVDRDGVRIIDGLIADITHQGLVLLDGYKGALETDNSGRVCIKHF